MSSGADAKGQAYNAGFTASADPTPPGGATPKLARGRGDAFDCAMIPHEPQES